MKLQTQLLCILGAIVLIIVGATTAFKTKEPERNKRKAPTEQVQSVKESRAEQPRESLFGKDFVNKGVYTPLYDGQNCYTYLFEYEGKKYILVITGSAMTMVEHKR